MSNAFRPFFWLLLAAALFARAFVPQGYMPERSADSTIAVALCGADGHWTLRLDGKTPAPEEPRTDPPCAFAGLGTPALPPAPPLLVPAVAAAAAAYFAPPAPTAPVRAEPFLPPARGPPVPA